MCVCWWFIELTFPHLHPPSWNWLIDSFHFLWLDWLSDWRCVDWLFWLTFYWLGLFYLTDWHFLTFGRLWFVSHINFFPPDFYWLSLLFVYFFLLWLGSPSLKKPGKRQKQWECSVSDIRWRHFRYRINIYTLGIVNVT